MEEAEVKEKFGSALGEEEAGWAKQNVSFFCLFFSFFSRVCGGGGKEKGGAPTRTLKNPGQLLMCGERKIIYYL